MLPYQAPALACPATTHPPLRLASLRLRRAYSYAPTACRGYYLPTPTAWRAAAPGRQPRRIRCSPTTALPSHPALQQQHPTTAHRTPHAPPTRAAAARHLPGYLRLSSPPGACLAMPKPSCRCNRWTCTEGSPARQPPVRGRPTLGLPPRAKLGRRAPKPPDLATSGERTCTSHQRANLGRDFRS